MRTLLAVTGVLALAVALVLAAGPVLPHSGYAGYSHSAADRALPRGQWVTVGSVPAGGCCKPVTFSVQAPVIHRTGPAVASLRVRFLRLPARDGTGDLDMTVGGARRWHVTHSHTVRGFTGRMAAQLFVRGTGTWHSPYRIVKGVR